MFKKIFDAQKRKKNKYNNFYFLDNFTKSVSIELSRRKFLQGILASSAIIGIQLFNPIPAFAANCNSCTGPCGNCSSGTGPCCSPNGQYCYSCNWNCPSCACGGCPDYRRRPSERVCNSGSHGCGVYDCC